MIEKLLTPDGLYSIGFVLLALAVAYRLWKGAGKSELGEMLKAAEHIASKTNSKVDDTLVKIVQAYVNGKAEPTDPPSSSPPSRL